MEGELGGAQAFPEGLSPQEISYSLLHRHVVSWGMAKL